MVNDKSLVDVHIHPHSFYVYYQLTVYEAVLSDEPFSSSFFFLFWIYKLTLIFKQVKYLSNTIGLSFGLGFIQLRSFL